MPLQHNPADRATCSICGVAEDIHLLDGVLDERDQATDQIACIRCYPAREGSVWVPTSEAHIAVSIAPELAPLYQAFINRRRLYAARVRLARIRVLVETLKKARNELRDIDCETPANFVARALNALNSETRQAQDSITALENLT